MNILTVNCWKTKKEIKKRPGIAQFEQMDASRKRFDARVLMQLEKKWELTNICFGAFTLHWHMRKHSGKQLGKNL